MDLVRAVPNPELIHDIRRECRYQRERVHPGVFPVSALKAAGPILDTGLPRVIQAAFVGVDETEFVGWTEVVIDPYVDLVSIVLVVGIPVGHILSGDAPRKPDARGVQTVSNSPIVRLRHPRQQDIFNPSGGIIAGPVRVVGKHIERLQRSCRGGRPDGISLPVHGRIVLKRIGVVGAGEVTENALPGGTGQHRSDEVLFHDVPLFVDKEEEKRLVPDNRTAQTPSKLVPVFPVGLDAIEVVEPTCRVESRVPVVPEYRTAPVVGSRAGHHLHLTGTAAGFRIHGSSGDAYFFDQIGARIGRRKRSMVVPPGRNREAVAAHVGVADAAAGEIAVDVALLWAGARHGPEQLENIAVTRRQFADLEFGQHDSDR